MFLTLNEVQLTRNTMVFKSWLSQFGTCLYEYIVCLNQIYGYLIDYMTWLKLVTLEIVSIHWYMFELCLCREFILYSLQTWIVNIILRVYIHPSIYVLLIYISLYLSHNSIFDDFRNCQKPKIRLMTFWKQMSLKPTQLTS